MPTRSSFALALSRTVLAGQADGPGTATTEPQNEESRKGIRPAQGQLRQAMVNARKAAALIPRFTGSTPVGGAEAPGHDADLGLSRGVGPSGRRALAGHVEQADLDRDELVADVGRVGHGPPPVQVLLRLPALEVVDPARIDRVGRHGDVEAARGGPGAPHEVLEL